MDATRPLVLPSASRNGLKELRWLDPQGVRQLNDVEQPKVALTALDSTYVVAMQVSELCQTLLGETTFNSQLVYAPAK